MEKLLQYLHDTARDNETIYARIVRFAHQLGDDVSEYAVRKWAYGQRRVPDAMKIRIERVTNRQVTIEDLVRG